MVAGDGSDEHGQRSHRLQYEAEIKCGGTLEGVFDSDGIQIRVIRPLVVVFLFALVKSWPQVQSGETIGVPNNLVWPASSRMGVVPPMVDLSLM